MSIKNISYICNTLLITFNKLNVTNSTPCLINIYNNKYYYKYKINIYNLYSFKNALITTSGFRDFSKNVQLFCGTTIKVYDNNNNNIITRLATTDCLSSPVNSPPVNSPPINSPPVNSPPINYPPINYPPAFASFNITQFCEITKPLCN